MTSASRDASQGFWPWVLLEESIKSNYGYLYEYHKLTVIIRKNNVFFQNHMTYSKMPISLRGGHLVKKLLFFWKLSFMVVMKSFLAFSMANQMNQLDASFRKVSPPETSYGAPYDSLTFAPLEKMTLYTGLYWVSVQKLEKRFRLNRNCHFMTRKTQNFLKKCQKSLKLRNPLRP